MGVGAGHGHRGHPAPSPTGRGRGAHDAAREGRLRLSTAGGGGPGRPRPRCEHRLSPAAICPAARPGPELPPRKIMPLPPAQTRSEPCGQSLPLRPPPTPAGPGKRWRRSCGSAGGRGSGSSSSRGGDWYLCLAAAPAPSRGEGATKNPSQTEVRAPVSLPSRGPRRPTFCGSLRADVQAVAVAVASCGSRLSLRSGARAPHSGLD